MKNIFLCKVYRYNKKLFILFVAFASITVLCNFTGNEITPFYVWGMYSEKEIAPKEYPVFRISVNDQPLDYTTGYFPANRFFLVSPLSYYSFIKETNDDPTLVLLKHTLRKKYTYIQPYTLQVLNSKMEVNEFPVWYKRYLQQTTEKEIKSVKVDVLLVSYQQGKLKIDSVYNVIDEK